MAKTREELNIILGKMVEELGIEKTLQELANAQSSKELEENLEYIDSMWELHLMEGNN